MSLRTSLILMVIFLALGYLAVFEPLRTAPKEEEKAELESHVFWFKDKRLDSFSISTEKGNIAFECTIAKKCPLDGTGEWKLSPGNEKADSTAVAGFLGSLSNLTHNGKIDFDNGYDPKEFGLDHPKATVAFQFAVEQGAKAQPNQIKSVVLTFGMPSAVGPNSYLSVSDEPKHLFLVPTYLIANISQEKFHWQNKRVFPTAESTAVNAIRWKSKKAGEISAKRVGDGWQLVKPKELAASTIMFDGLGSTLSYLSAKSVFAESRNDPSVKKLLAGKPELEITFSLNGDGEHVVKLFPNPKAPKETVVVADKDEVVYSTPSANFDRFDKDLPEYRQRSLLTDAERSQVNELHFQFPRDGADVTLQLQHGIWNQTNGSQPKGMIMQSRISGFLDQLRDADYKSFFPAKGDSPEARAWRKESPDLHVEAIVNGKQVGTASFLVFDRKLVLTESEGDVRVVGTEAFQKMLPIRLNDLTETANRAVVTSEKEGAHGIGSQLAPSRK